MRIAIIGSARYAIQEPFAGGLEAHTWTLTKALRRRGHEITIFAGTGCDPALSVRELNANWPPISDAARSDVSITADAWLEEHHACRAGSPPSSTVSSSTTSGPAGTARAPASRLPDDELPVPHPLPPTCRNHASPSATSTTGSG